MKKNDAFVLRDIEGRHILMPVRANAASDDPIVLNEVAAYIWLAATDGASIDEIEAKVAEEYSLKDGSPERMAVTAFVEQLCKMGLLINEMKEGA